MQSPLGCDGASPTFAGDVSKPDHPPAAEERGSPAALETAGQTDPPQESGKQQEVVYEACPRCDLPILEQRYIKAETAKWHAECFICKDCGIPLEARGYRISKGDVYCETHYNEHLELCCDRCKLIILDRCITALDAHWHPECFSCDSCGTVLTGGTVMKRNKRPYCKPCHEQHRLANLALQKNVCQRCKKPILDSMLVLKGKKYHASHFSCAYCKKELRQDYQEHEGRLFCPECYERLNNPACVACDQMIYGRVVTAMGKTYHPEHFRCVKCHVILQETAFYDYEGFPYCRFHYYEALGELCGRCFGPASGSAVITAVNGQRWCEEHFLCFGCDQDLVGAKFLEWDLKPVCRKCFDDLPRALRKRLDMYYKLQEKVNQARKKQEKGG